MAASKLLKHPMRIIANCEEKLTQSGAINTSISYRQLIFCSRKNKRVKQTTINRSLFFHLKIIQWTTLNESYYVPKLQKV